MKNTKIVWRLSKLPTPDELRELVKDKIITQEEAREILFSSEEQEDRDKESLQSEIKFLREIVEKLSQGRDRIVEVIKEVRVPYYQHYPWYGQYEVWCGNNPTFTDTSTSVGYVGCSTTASNTAQSFSDIKTF